MIDALVSIHFRENVSQPEPEWIEIWLSEARSPEMIVELIKKFPDEAREMQKSRPLLSFAIEGNLPDLRTALDAEVRAEQEKDRIYWEPLKREMEAFRRAEREKDGGCAG